MIDLQAFVISNRNKMCNLIFYFVKEKTFSKIFVKLGQTLQRSWYRTTTTVIRITASAAPPHMEAILLFIYRCSFVETILFILWTLTQPLNGINLLISRQQEHALARNLLSIHSTLLRPLMGLF